MKRFCFALLLAWPLTLQAQDTDVSYVDNDSKSSSAGLWTELEASKTLPYNLSLDFGGGLRTNEWFDQVSRWDLSVGLGYKPFKGWKFGFTYAFIMKQYDAQTASKAFTELEYKYRPAGATENVTFPSFMGAPTYSDGSTTYTYRGYNEEYKDYTRYTESYWRAKHRLALDAAYSYKFWKTLRVGLRERYQLSLLPAKDVQRTYGGTKATTRYRDPSYDADGNVTYDEVEGPLLTPRDSTATKSKGFKAQHVLRSRLTLEIDRKGWAWTPYVACELFNNLKESWHLDKVRATIGVNYAISKQHRVNLGYVFNHENDDDGNHDIHAISIGYKFKF